jgi:hypothetical protein
VFSCECVARVSAHSEGTTGLVFSADCKRLLSTGGDGCIMVWKLAPSITRVMQERLAELADGSLHGVACGSLMDDSASTTSTAVPQGDNVPVVTHPVVPPLILKAAPPPLPSIRTSGFERAAIGSSTELGAELESSSVMLPHPHASASSGGDSTAPPSARMGVSQLLALVGSGTGAGLSAGASASDGASKLSDATLSARASASPSCPAGEHPEPTVQPIRPSLPTDSAMTESTIHDVGQPTDDEADGHDEDEDEDEYSGKLEMWLPY